jgi:hypothetical protein
MTNNDELAFIAKAALKAGQGSKEMVEFRVTANPANILALLAERYADKKLIELNTEMFLNADRDIAALRQRIRELETVSTAAEKLVRCKGRYHSEQNYRSLAALFGVSTPDLPPLETEARTVSVTIKPPTVGRAYSALAHVWTVQEVREACADAGIKLEVGE